MTKKNAGLPTFTSKIKHETTHHAFQIGITRDRWLTKEE